MNVSNTVTIRILAIFGLAVLMSGCVNVSQHTAGNTHRVRLSVRPFAPGSMARPQQGPNTQMAARTARSGQLRTRRGIMVKNPPPARYASAPGTGTGSMPAGQAAAESRRPARALYDLDSAPAPIDGGENSADPVLVHVVE